MMLAFGLRFSMASTFATLVWSLLWVMCSAQKIGDRHEFDLTNPISLTSSWSYNYNCDGEVKTSAFIVAASRVFTFEVTPIGKYWVATTVEGGSNKHPYQQFQFVMKQEGDKYDLQAVYVLFNRNKNYKDGRRCNRV